MTSKYETIKMEKSLNFRSILSNEIITNLVKKIEQYEQAREMETKYYYYKKITNQGEKIKKIKMKSKDKIIVGKIKYLPQENAGLAFYTMPISASIEAEFNFNSNNEADKTEYQGLVKLIKNM